MGAGGHGPTLTAFKYSLEKAVGGHGHALAAFKTLLGKQGSSRGGTVGGEGGRAVRARGGVGMHWLEILLFRKCKQPVRERWSGRGSSRGGTVGGEGAGGREGGDGAGGHGQALAALKYFYLENATHEARKGVGGKETVGVVLWPVGVMGVVVVPTAARARGGVSMHRQP